MYSRQSDATMAEKKTEQPFVGEELGIPAPSAAKTDFDASEQDVEEQNVTFGGLPPASGGPGKFIKAIPGGEKQEMWDTGAPKGVGEENFRGSELHKGIAPHKAEAPEAPPVPSGTNTHAAGEAAMLPIPTATHTQEHQLHHMTVRHPMPGAVHKAHVDLAPKTSPDNKGKPKATTHAASVTHKPQEGAIKHAAMVHPHAPVAAPVSKAAHAVTHKTVTHKVAPKVSTQSGATASPAIECKTPTNPFGAKLRPAAVETKNTPSVPMPTGTHFGTHSGTKPAVHTGGAHGGVSAAAAKFSGVKPQAHGDAKPAPGKLSADRLKVGVTDASHTKPGSVANPLFGAKHGASPTKTSPTHAPETQEHPEMSRPAPPPRRRKSGTAGGVSSESSDTTESTSSNPGEVPVQAEAAPPAQ